MAEDDDEVFLTEHVFVTLDVEVWLKEKDVPLHPRMKVRYDKDNLPETVQQLTDSFATIIMDAFDRRSVFGLTLSDERDNKFIVELDQIQAINVMAPDELPEALKETNE